MEDADDLIADLEQAFDLASNVHVRNVRSVRRRGSSVDGIPPLAPTAVTPGATGGAAAPGGVSHGLESANREDAAELARQEVLRLQGVVRVLQDRLGEAAAAGGGRGPPPQLPQGLLVAGAIAVGFAVVAAGVAAAAAIAITRRR